MAAITDSKHVYDEIAKAYFISEGYNDVTINKKTKMVDLTASLGKKKVLIEVKGPKELSADSKTTYKNMIGGMDRPKIARIINSAFDKKTLWGYVGLTRLYCYGIVSELYHYYKEEKLKSEVDAFFCVPAEDKYSVAINSAIAILGGLGFIKETSKDEYSEDRGKIIIIKIIFNDEITETDAKEKTKKKDKINEKIEEAKAESLSKFKLKNPSIYRIANIIPGLPAMLTNPATLNAAGIAAIVIICLILLWFIIKCFMSGCLNIPTKDTTMKSPVIVVVTPAKMNCPAIVATNAKPFIISFDFDESTINPIGIESLKCFVQEAKIETGKKIKIDGHTCNVGTETYNNRLSLLRANSVKDFLLGKSFLKEKIITPNGHGYKKPVNRIETEEGRRQNRRVEIRIE